MTVVSDPKGLINFTGGERAQGSKPLMEDKPLTADFKIQVE